MIGRIPTEPLYRSGFHSLEGDIAAIRRRMARGRERADDAADLEALELALAELRALYRADLRCLLEEVDSPLDVALVQCEELIADGLPIRHLSPGMRDALRRDREADYAVVLYGLAGSGTSPVST